MAVFGLGQTTKHKTEVIPIKGLDTANNCRLAVDVTRFGQFWDLMDAVQLHGYIRAAMSVIGRSTVGTWWKLRKHEEYGDQGTERQRRRLMAFYLMPDKRWDNIQDYQSLAGKLLIGAMYLKYFGRAAYQILRNDQGRAVGMDFLPGYVVPNVDPRGFFQDPPFVQYPEKDLTRRVEFADPREIVYIVNPDWEGFPGGGADTQALADFAIPIDLYLQIAAREYMKNRDKPEAFYVLPSDISDEAFDDFVKKLENRYDGPTNVGRSPIAVQGELDIKELSRLPSDLPYQGTRSDVRQELLAVSGVAGAKLGITESLSAANLREARREFHESTMLPLFRLMELALYEQIHVREFQAMGWEFRFNSPDFLTAVERATVHMRYKQIGVLNANEIRYEIGLPPRADDDGNRYEDELDDDQNPQGSPPEGREEDPASPGIIGEPTLDDQDPPRGDQHDETPRDASFLTELRGWRTFAVDQLKRRQITKGITDLSFAVQAIPPYLQKAIQGRLQDVKTVVGVHQLFDEVETLLEEFRDE